MTDIQETEETQEVEQVSLQEDIGSALSEQEPEDTVAETVEEETVQEVIEALQAPQYWDAETKTIFDSWGEVERGREYQEAMIAQYGKTEAYTDEKKREAAEFRKQVQGWNDTLQPYQDFMMGHGLTPQEAARRGIGIMTNINQDPQKFALDILQRMNYDFAQHGQDAPYIPPEVKQLQDKLSGLETALQNQTQEQQQQAYRAQQEQFQREAAEMNEQIKSFATQKDESGTLLHPHFESVENLMAQLVHGYRGMNKPIPEMAQLYEEACNHHPDIQAKIKAEEQQKETARKAKEAKKAKGASDRVTGKHTGGKSETSLKEDIASALSNQAA